jgi:YVTN family beta-propeller protein
MGLVVGCQLTAPPPPRIPVVLATIRLELRDWGRQIAVNRRTGYVYFAQDSGFTILKDTKLMTQLLYPADDGPSHVAVEELNNLTYITNAYNDIIKIVQGDQLVATLETIGSNPQEVAVEPKSQLVYVVSSYRKRERGGTPIVEGNVMVIKQTEVITNLMLGRLLLTHVAADPIGGYIYTGGTGGVVVALKDLQEVMRYQVKYLGVDRPSVNAMDADLRTGDVYVLSSDGQLTRFRAGKVNAEARFWKQQRDSIRNVRVHPLTGDVYLVNWGTREVIVVRDMKEIARLPVGKGALQTAIDLVTGNVYVANYDQNSVTVINGTEVLATISVGRYPYGIGVNPTNGWVYVANLDDNTVSVLGYPSPNFTPPPPTKAPTAPTRAPTRAPTPKPYP